MVASTPSDGAAVLGTWEFKKASDPSKIYEQSLTDRVKYSARLKGKQIVINLNGATRGLKKIVIEPVGNRPVSLILLGKHPAQPPGAVHSGASIDHFCAFYQLLLPVPADGDQFKPTFNGVPAASTIPSTGAPSPGVYCPGDWP